MAGLTAEAIRGMTDDALEIALKDIQRTLFQLRFQSATDRLETPSEIRRARREIARIKTILRERELKQAQGSTNG
ncbi:MAG: 50S ribosomal protein L29 [Zavarzinella sp.]